MIITRAAAKSMNPVFAWLIIDRSLPRSLKPPARCAHAAESQPDHASANTTDALPRPTARPLAGRRRPRPRPVRARQGSSGHSPDQVIGPRWMDALRTDRLHSRPGTTADGGLLLRAGDERRELFRPGRGVPSLTMAT